MKTLGRRDEAARLVRAAQALRDRFNDAFWCEEIGSFALALDPDGRQVGSVGSNAMHCVATGIAEETLGRRVLAAKAAGLVITAETVRTSAQARVLAIAGFDRGGGPFAEAGLR